MKKRPSGAGENIWLTLDSRRCPCTFAVVWMYFKENFLAVRVHVPSPVPAGCFSEPLAPAGMSGEEQRRPCSVSFSLLRSRGSKLAFALDKS